MAKKLLYILLVLSGLGLSAQTSISGFVDLDTLEASNKIHLSQIALEDLSADRQSIAIRMTEKLATTTIDKNGFFRFKQSLTSDKEAIYRLHVKRFEAALKDSVQVDQLFLLSNNDSIHFKKSKIPFAEYTNTNLADKEWQKLRRFERQLRKSDFKKEDSLSEAYVASLKSYAKDSLEILMVKLIGIKQLDTKDLLEKDIAKNPDYYLALLTELKESDIERSEYLFLENKLAFLTTEAAENKYATSKIINMLLGLIAIGLIVLIYRLQRTKKHNQNADLSQQERNVKGLILEGKSNKEIANELFISLSTVKTHITNIYSKLRVSSRQELLRKAQNS